MRLPTLVATSAATATTAALGSIANRRSIPTWYRTLDKPAYVPPTVVFPVAWTALYADIAATGAATIDGLEPGRRRAYLIALGTNLVLNAGWSWIFFGWHRLGLSALGAAALTVSSVDLARRSAREAPSSGLALAPYPAWCAFATVMSTDIWRRNR